jgi:UDP-N-acetyl-D-mannosaminuronic acid transferase (WecB/TagA/CpsF family)
MRTILKMLLWPFRLLVAPWRWDKRNREILRLIREGRAEYPKYKDD